MLFLANKGKIILLRDIPGKQIVSSVEKLELLLQEGAGPPSGGPWGHLFASFCNFCRFRGPEAFQRLPGGRGYLLTKYEPKRTHLDLIHAIFDDFP